MLHINIIPNYPLFHFVPCGPFTQIKSMHPDFSNSYHICTPATRNLHSLHLNPANYNMSNFKKYQILILSLIVVLLSLTPFLSSSIRSAHLYIVINILILTVGVESGLLSGFAKSPNEEKKSAESNAVSKEKLDSSTIVSTTDKIVTPMVIQSNMEKISNVATEDVAIAKKVKIPSIFFISSGEVEGDEDGGDLCSVGDAMAEQELSTKADDFINNFYKQLKMQKEVS